MCCNIKSDINQSQNLLVFKTTSFYVKLKNKYSLLSFSWVFSEQIMKDWFISLCVCVYYITSMFDLDFVTFDIPESAKDSTDGGRSELELRALKQQLSQKEKEIQGKILLII